MDYEVKTVYIYRHIDSSINYIEKILFEFNNGGFDYFEMPENYLELSDSNRFKYKHQLLKKLNKYHYLTLPKDSIVEITEDSEYFKKFRRKIKCLSDTNKRIYNRFINKLFLIGSSLNLITSCLYFCTDSFVKSLIFNLISTLCSTHSLLYGLEEKDYTKKNNFGLQSRLYFNFLLLIGNIILGVSNIKIYNYDLKQELYSLEYSLTKDYINSKQTKIVVENNPFESDYITVDLKGELLVKSFDNNPFFREEDLEIVNDLVNYLNDNKHLDYKEIYDTYSTVGFIHSKEDFGIVVGKYLVNDNIIVDYVHGDSFYGETMFHEFVHITGRLDSKVLNEGMTSLITTEYYNDGKEKDGYSIYQNMTKIICELIGADTMLEAYSKNDNLIIDEAFYKINPKVEDYKKLNILLEAMEQDDFQFDFETIYSVIKPYVLTKYENDLDDDCFVNVLLYINDMVSGESYNYKYYFVNEESSKTLIK